MACCEHKHEYVARTPSVAYNMQHLKECCKVHEEEDVSGIVHPAPQFMERAIYLSRVAGLEKRTGV